jgi:hypothetical protein
VVPIQAKDFRQIYKQPDGVRKVEKMGNGELIETSRALTAADIKAQVNLIQEVMKGVMQGPSKENPEGVHYGIIPGCKKPSLLKPGAEKLSMTFRLRPIIDNDKDVHIDHLDRGHREVRVYCHVFNMAGVELATGIGSCSTLETKFRYRGGEKKSTGQAVPKEYWNLKKEGKLQEALETIGGSGFGVMKGETGWEICEHGEKMENPDIADVYNTVLKMAKKRAYIDGILSSTGASDIFTQDIEELPPDVVAATEGAPDKEPSKPKVEPSTARSATSDLGDPSKAIECECGAVISEKVAKYSMDKFKKHLCFECQKAAK